MFELYTETARRVIFSARYMAGRAGSPEIETEHLLLGILREDKGLARRFLGSPWIAEEIWLRIRQSKPAREKIPGPVDLPLSSASKRALAFAAEEAALLSNKHICTEHLLLGLLREERCLASEILQERGLRLTHTREELQISPHNDSAHEEYVRERSPRPQEILGLQSQLDSIKDHLYEAIANSDFEAARMHSKEEGKVRDKLFDLYQQYGLLDWIYE